MIVEIRDHVIEINTSEAYNKEIYFIDGNLIIPYINLEIFDINLVATKLKKYDKLDFSYLIFKDVKEMLWKYEFTNEINYGKLVFDNFSNENDYLIDYVETTNVFTELYGFDFEIKYKEQYLYFSEDVGIKNGPLSFWIPIDTPNFRQNLNEEKVRSFFTKDNIPKEVLELVEVSGSAMLETLNISKVL